jgi:hypothetical protein
MRSRSIFPANRPPTPRAPNDRFRRFVRGFDPVDKELPWTHVTDGWHFRDIIEQERLQPTNCSIFLEPLLYFFYGRPAYRIASETATTAYAPICFILRPDAVSPNRLYPFDTGGFNRIKAAFHAQTVRDDFALDTDQTSARRLIGCFFTGPKEYLLNRPKPVMDIPLLEFEAAEYFRLISGQGGVKNDERGSTIESQVSAAVGLQGSALAVVLPDNFVDEPTVRAALTKLGIDVIAYDFVAQMAPSTYASSFYQLVKDYYARSGWL